MSRIRSKDTQPEMVVRNTINSQTLRSINKYAYLYFMKARLNVSIDEGLLEQVKTFARKNDIKMSQLVADYFNKIAKLPVKKNIIDLIEELDKPEIDPNANLRDIYYAGQDKQYGK